MIKCTCCFNDKMILKQNQLLSAVPVNGLDQTFDFLRIKKPLQMICQTLRTLIFGSIPQHFLLLLFHFLIITLCPVLPLRHFQFHGTKPTDDNVFRCLRKDRFVSAHLAFIDDFFFEYVHFCPLFPALILCGSDTDRHGMFIFIIGNGKGIAIFVIGIVIPLP